MSATSPAARPLVAPSDAPGEAPYAVAPFCRDAMVSLRKAVAHVAVPAAIRALLDDAVDCAPLARALPTLCNASAGALVVDGVDVRPLARFCAKTCDCPIDTWLLSDDLYAEAVAAIRFLVSLDARFAAARASAKTSAFG